MSIDVLFQQKGAPVLIHEEGDLIPCPCRTPEGFRDPAWHKANPEAPECNANGFLFDSVEYIVKAFVQPASYGGRNMNLTQLFGEVQQDDHIGLFPLMAGNVALDFSNWVDTGADYVQFNGMRFVVVGWSIIPDPHDSSLNHHWEVALRRIQAEQYGPNIGY